jgi:hypothetical protein
MVRAPPLTSRFVELINPPAPPPPACLAPPPPPPATTNKSIFNTPDGGVQLQVPRFLIATYVKPPLEVVVGEEQDGCDEVIETTFESVPPVFVAVTV